MLTIIGVAHVFDLAAQIEKIILDKRPDVVCVELDRARYLALKHRTPKVKLMLPYKLLALFQQKIAAKYGTRVGQEMLTAVETATKLNISIEFIDMDSVYIFATLWKSMSLAEKLKFLLGSIFGLFVKKEELEKELKKFESSYDQYMQMFGTEFPTVKKILIDERNQYMATMLRRLCEKHQRVLAIVGEGHVKGLKALLTDLEPEIISLSALRTIKTQTSEVSVSYVLGENDQF
jgi:pheromone shutdown protein TraB